MTVEYLLLLTLFVLFLMKGTYYGPHDAFRNAAPKLAARVEKQLITGERFSVDANSPATDWREK